MIKRQNDSLMQPESAQTWTNAIARTVGYGLLILSLFDIISILYPPQLMNPVWEFQTMGALVERVAVPLLGIFLVFSGADAGRKVGEGLILKFLSWLCLLVAVLLLLMIPLGINNTLRINRQIIQQATEQYQNQMAQVVQVEKQLSQTSPEDLKKFIQSQGGAVNNQDPQQLKTNFSVKITESKQKFYTQSQQKQASQRLNVFKNSLKWNLGALVAAALFIYIWLMASWAW